jgi:hypothetical protein
MTRTWVFDDQPAGPFPRWDAGASLRLRFVDMAYAADLGLGSDPDQFRQFLRVRSRLWATHRFSPNAAAYIRLNNESRRHLDCPSCDNRFHEIIFENLYFEAAQILGLPVGLRLGRQDLFYGDGLVICDGTPLDGSRTSYVNGALVTFVLDPWSFDAFVTWNRMKDEYLPRINNKFAPLLESNEIVTGIYFRRLLSPEWASKYLLEHYYIFKEEQRPGWIRSVNTLGTRLGFPVYRLRVTGEAAYQAGETPEAATVQIEDTVGPQTVTAYGAQIKVTTHVNSPVPMDLAGGYIHLSGDDPISQKEDEGWDPVLGRWPQWSELYIYTLTKEADMLREAGVAYWQNLEAPYIRIAVEPRPSIRLEAGHMWMDSSQPVPFSSRVKERDPLYRGDLLILKLSWKAGAWHKRVRLSGHVLYERFSPGDFYREIPINLFGSDPEPASFLRVEFSASI